MVTEITGLVFNRLQGLDKANKTNAPDTIARAEKPGAIAGSNVEATQTTVADTLLGELSSLRNLRQDLQREHTGLQIAGNHTSQIRGITERLGELAVQASDVSLNGDQRSALNAEFKSLQSEIDRLATATTDFASNQPASLLVSLPDLSSNELFGGADLSLSTTEGADEAQALLAVGAVTVRAAEVEIGQNLIQSDTDIAALDTAILQFSQSNPPYLDGTETEATNLALEAISINASQASRVQGKSLQPALLDLL